MKNEKDMTLSREGNGFDCFCSYMKLNSFLKALRAPLPIRNQVYNE